MCCLDTICQRCNQRNTDTILTRVDTVHGSPDKTARQYGDSGMTQQVAREICIRTLCARPEIKRSIGTFNIQHWFQNWQHSVKFGAVLAAIIDHMGFVIPRRDAGCGDDR